MSRAFLIVAAIVAVAIIGIGVTSPMDTEFHRGFWDGLKTPFTFWLR